MATTNLKKILNGKSEHDSFKGLSDKDEQYWPFCDQYNTRPLVLLFSNFGKGKMTPPLVLGSNWGTQNVGGIWGLSFQRRTPLLHVQFILQANVPIEHILNI